MSHEIARLDDEQGRFARGNVPHDLIIVSPDLIALRALIDAIGGKVIE